MGEQNFLDEVVDMMVEEIGGVSHQFDKEIPLGMETANMKRQARQFSSLQSDDQRQQFIDKVKAAQGDTKGIKNLMNMAEHLERNRERV
jgi:hypothetical protein